MDKTSTDWDDHWTLTGKKEVLKTLSKQTSNGSYCDIILVVDDEEFPAHKCVLASCSDYFNEMFTVEMQEKYEKKVELKGINANTFPLMLDWIYNEQILLTVENFVVLYRESSVLQIRRLSDVLQIWLEKHFENKLLLAQLIMKFTYDEVSQILDSDKLKISSEIRVFDFIVKWIYHDSETRRVYFPSLFKLLRLQCVPLDVVWDRIFQHELVCEFVESQSLAYKRLSPAFFASVSEYVGIKTQRVSTIKPNLFLQFLSSKQPINVYDVETKLKTTYSHDLINLDSVNIKDGCAIATRYPMSILCGGKDYDGPRVIASRNVFKFTKQIMTKLPDMNEPRYGAAAVFFGDYLYVFGGQSAETHTWSPSTKTGNPDLFYYKTAYEKWNKNWNCWNYVFFPFTPRSFLAAHTLKDKIYLIGGFEPSTGEEDHLKNKNTIPSRIACKITTMFSPRKKSCTEICPMTTARAAFASAVFNSNIYVCGGMGRYEEYLSAVEFLDTTNRIWTNLTTSCLDTMNLGLVGSSCAIEDKLYIDSLNRVIVYDYAKKSFAVVYHKDVRNRRFCVLLPFDKISLEKCLKIIV